MKTQLGVPEVVRLWLVFLGVFLTFFKVSDFGTFLFFNDFMGFFRSLANYWVFLKVFACAEVSKNR